MAAEEKMQKNNLESESTPIRPLSETVKWFPVEYLGFTSLDRRYSNSMLPWIIGEIQARGKNEQIVLCLTDVSIKGVNTDTQTILFEHDLLSIMRCSSIHPNRKYFMYFLRDLVEPVFLCYLFRAQEAQLVVSLFTAMRENIKDMPLNVSSNNLSLASLGTELGSSQFFEVLYIGKIKVPGRKAPPTFIDEAIEKFRIHEQNKVKNNNNLIKSDDASSQESVCTSDGGTPEYDGQTQIKQTDETETNDSAILRSVSMDNKALSYMLINTTRPRQRTSSGGASLLKSISLPCQNEPMRNRAFSTGADMKSNDHGQTQNRTMLLLIGRNDIHLVSPDRKSVLVRKFFKEISQCGQGMTNPSHFGFICREATSDSYVGFIFKCQCDTVAEEIFTALKQAFVSAQEMQRKDRLCLQTCDHCPMVWFHRLCTDLEGVPDNRAHSVILKRIESLPPEEETSLREKCRGAEAPTIADQNQVLMMLLRAHCESKQIRHVHDSVESRQEFLNQYLSGGTIFMKAKKSLTTSFDNLLKRKNSVGNMSPVGQPTLVKELSLPSNCGMMSNGHMPNPTTPVKGSSGVCNVDDITVSESPLAPMGRPRSSTVATGKGEMIKKELALRRGNQGQPVNSNRASPIMNIFLKVGSQPRLSPGPESPTDEHGHPNGTNVGSWRQAIFHRVVSPASKTDNMGVAGGRNQRMAGKKTARELRSLWKKAIMQQILLIRMEKENKKLKVHQEEVSVKRLKLLYEDLTVTVKEVGEAWDAIMMKEYVDTLQLQTAVNLGVPRPKRGQVWQYLAQNHIYRSPVTAPNNCPNYTTSYDDLLKQLTSQQHAILIDLGRTFPNHPYYMTPLGAGQLSLFNLLKAYSLLDQDVGYCQGLSFVAGVLLLHVSEEEAFQLLKHLMFDMGLRHQYKPDMEALQIQMYQFSRLLHDQERVLYEHFEQHEIAPTLYVAPWFLTLFASQFPLGFVTRMLDLLFLCGTEVIHKITIVLMSEHRDELLKCDSFELIMSYLKTTMTNVTPSQLSRIVRQVSAKDISKELNAYEIEYHVLQEEMLSTPKVNYNSMHKLEMANKNLKCQNQDLIEQLQNANMTVTHIRMLNETYQKDNHQLVLKVHYLEEELRKIAAYVDDGFIGNGTELPQVLKKYRPQAFPDLLSPHDVVDYAFVRRSPSPMTKTSRKISRDSSPEEMMPSNYHEDSDDDIMGLVHSRTRRELVKNNSRRTGAKV